MAGTLSNLFANEGDTVAVGKPLYEIDDAGKKPEAAKKEEPAPQAVEKPKSETKATAPPPPAKKEAKPASKSALSQEKSKKNTLYSLIY